VLDAQYFGVAQRRRRVFVVGHLGDWQPTAKVLFESESLRWDLKASRKPRQATTSSFTPSIANCLQTTCNDYSRADGFNMICADVTHVADKCPTITSSASGYSRAGNGVTEHETYVAYALQGAGATSQSANGSGIKQNQSFTLNCTDVHGVAYGFEPGIAKREGNPTRFSKEMSPTLRASMGDNQVALANNMAVRRLTPIECERLQGFPDNYTNIKDKCPDGPRYKAMGNSMAVPVMAWLGKRIQMAEDGLI
jgi:DNA (cytosine-5)-methyltransferase 1